MSLILDALKRVERERRVERGADLSALYEAGPDHSRKTWLRLLVILLLALNLFVLGFLFRSHRAETQKASPTHPHVSSVMPAPPGGTRSDAVPTEPSVAPAQTAVPEVAAHPAPPRFVNPGGPARPLSKEASAGGDRNARPRSAVRPAQGALSSLSHGIPGEAHPGEGAVMAKISDPAPVPFPAAPFLADGETPPRLPEMRTAAKEKEAAASAPGRVAASASSAASEGIPRIKELPESIREELIGFRINVHAYHEDPGECFVFINMRRYAQGDRIGGDGPRVEIITTDGVVLDYGEGKAFLPTVN